MNYLVTGAAGFIGGAIAQRLIAQGNRVTTIDNLFTGVKERVPQECIFINGDVSDSAVIDSLKKEKFDAIIHMAGQSSGEVSFDNPVYDLHTNTQSTILLLRYALETGCKKFIYASSMSTYGDHNPPICSEATQTIPKSFYAVGKLASENYMRIYSEYGIACTALRFFNVYGIGQNMDNLRQGMASIYLSMALRNRHIHVKGSKERFRDFVYIDDVVNAVLASLERESGYEYYNVCTGIPTTVERVVEKIKESLPFDVSVEYSGSTPGDQFGIYGSNDKIREDLGWSPLNSFDDGMAKMIEWARTL
ncbi:NAD-dependent epimerase/dehydratase family protein [Butyrivibrio fibrisolvens]|uniref:NAD-dependent epimerase/dehydratase family protein n=1 Tax=Butyrivibrio fibrisolvens TaxID=831 RepID=UPI00041BA97F|nr:NAD-dependent epimerase/dehydratase family protein [Butyrivibrio fibrisolvens]